jgi:hypothetical protein
VDQDNEKASYETSRGNTVKWLYAAIIAWAISFILMAAFGTYAVIQGQRVNKSLCRVTDDNRTTLVKILETVRDQQLERSDSVLESNLIRQGFGQLIALVPPLKCSATGGPKELGP